MWPIIPLLIRDPIVCGYLTGSDDINSTICDYATQVSWKITNTMMEHYHDKGLLGWLDSGMVPPHPRIVLNKWTGPEQWDIWKLAMGTEELVTWTGYFTD